MILVEVNYVFGKLESLNIKGHGGLEYGKDIICAGVSACAYGALNALNNAENYKIELKSGLLKLQKLHDSTTHDEIVLETLIMQLETIRKKFPDRVKIKVSGKEGNQ
jgi:uncharacterized protein